MYDNHQKIVKGGKKSGLSSIFLHVSEDLQLAKWNQINRCHLLSMLTDIQHQGSKADPCRTPKG